MHEDNINTLFDKTAPTSFKQWQKSRPVVRLFISLWRQFGGAT
jgi:hypothetical protein